MSRTKRFLAMLLVICMVASMVPGNVFAAGTEQLTQAAQDLLAAMETGSIANYTLTEDVDLGGATLPAVALTGTFNGNSKTISNAKIANADANGNMGFFSTVAAGAQVLNLNLKNITVDTTGTNATNVGIFAGLAESGATIAGGQKLAYDFYGTDPKGATVSHSTNEYSAEVILNLAAGTTIGLVGKNNGAAVSGTWRQISTEQNAVIKQRRADAAAYMMALGTIKWKTDKKLNLTIGGTKMSFYTGNSYKYYGIPYNHVASSLEQVMDIMDGPDANGFYNLKAFVEDAGDSTWGGDLGFSRYFGSDCSSSVSLAWNSVSPLNRDIGGVLVHETKWLLPTVDSQIKRGIIPVGYEASSSGTSGADISTQQIFTEIGGARKLYEAYSQTKQGDALVTYTPGEGGHARMLAEDPVIVRNADGSINPNESFFIIHEQGYGLTTDNWIDKWLDNYETSWGINVKYTFYELANKQGTITPGYYLPITMRGFLQEEYGAAASAKASDITAPNAGKITSGYKILKAELSMKDSQGNPVTLKNTYGPNGTALVVYNGVDGVANTYRGTNEYMDLSTHFANCLDGLAGGKYTFTIKATVSGGSKQGDRTATFTVVEDQVYNHLPETDMNAPVVAIDSYGYEDGSWAANDVVLSVSNTNPDNYGKVTYQYQVVAEGAEIDPDAWLDYTKAIIHTEDTNGAVYAFKATSQGGTESEVVSIVVRKETTKPSNVVVKYGENNFAAYANKPIARMFTDSATVTITANDEGSGIREITYKVVNVDGTVVKEGKLTEADNFAITIDEDFVGNVQVVSVVDKAGNRLNANYKTENFVVEKSAPTGITFNAKTGDKNYTSGTVANDAVTITVSGATAASGIAKYQYSTDAKIWYDMEATQSTAATATSAATVTEATLVIDETTNGVPYIFKAITNSGKEVITVKGIVVYVVGEEAPEWTESTSLPTIGKYKLATDVNVSGTTSLVGNLVLDLNGYTITRTVADGVTTSEYVFNQETKALTISDSSAEQTGTIKMVPATAGNVYSGNIAVVYANGEFTLDGGTLDNTAMITSYATANSGTVTVSKAFIMNGGVIKGQKNLSAESSKTGSAIGAHSNAIITINGGEVYGWKDPAEVAEGKTGSTLTAACKNGSVIAGGKTITINGGELHGSHASTHGGAIYTGANVYINGGLIADGYGYNHGGIYCTGTELVITGGTIKNNSNGVAANGNNIFKDNGTLTISGGTIGGGISIKGGKMILSGKPAIGEIEGTLYRADLLIVGTAGSIHIGSAESAAVQTAEGKYDVACDAEGNVVGATPFVAKWTDADSLPTSGTYKLTTNVNINADANSMKLTGDLDIDLNGYTITGTINGDIEAYIFRTNGYALVIRDSSAGQTGTLKMQHASVAAGTKQIAAVLADNGGTFTLEGGTLDNTAITTSHAAFSATVTLNNGTFIMNDGIVKGQKNTSTTGGSAIGTRTNASTITINGGKVYGWTDPAEADMPAAERTVANDQGSVIYAGTDTTITINGGELYGSNTTNHGSVISFYNSGSSVNIKGGKIYGGYVKGQYGAELYTKSINGIKINDTIVSKVATKYFIDKNEEGLTTSVVEAWTTADSLPTSGTYKLATDVNIVSDATDSRKQTGDLVLDLNGHSITGTVKTGTNEAYIIRNNSHNLTILDSSEGKTGTMKMVHEVPGTVCTSQIAILEVTGQTILEGGTLDNTAMVTSRSNVCSGAITITGGTFIMNDGVVKGQKNTGATTNVGSAIAIRYKASSTPSVTINGGKIYGWMDPAEVEAGKTGAELTAACYTGSVINAYMGTVNINGGELYGANTTDGGNVIYCHEAKLNINGGKISGGYVKGQYGAELRTAAAKAVIKINDVQAAAAAGQYFVVKNEEGLTTSVIEAWTTADSLPTSGTYKLATDVNVVSNATTQGTALTGNLDLDLNGHTITRTLEDGTGEAYVYRTDAYELTIRDSSANQTGLIKMEGAAPTSQVAAVEVKGKFTLEGGTIDNTAIVSSYTGAQSGAITINGGAFVMNGGVIKGQRNSSTDSKGGSVIGIRSSTAGSVEINGGKLYAWKDPAEVEAGKTGASLTAACNRGGVINAVGGNITINGGELHGAHATTHGGIIYTAGNVYINGGLIADGYTYNTAGGVYCTGTEMIITGGTIQNNSNANANAAKAYNVAKDKGTLTISGGTIGGGIGISGTNAKLVLTGKPVIGEIEGTLYRADVLINGTTASVHIGSADSEAVATAEGNYEVVTDNDGNVVDVIPFTAKKWTDATSLPTSGTYKLTTNVNINADANSMKLTGDLDLDLNGYTITGTINGDIEAYIFRTNGHALVIRDNSADQTGTLKMQHASVAAGTKQIAAVLADNGGTFTLEGGTLDNTAITTSHAAFSATVTLNKGTFIMNDGIVKGQKNTSTTGGSAIGTRTNASTITINGGKVYGWTDPAEADMPAAERTVANDQGSVIYAGTDTTITINGGELYGSNTTNHGSVISFYNSGSSVNIKGGKIYGGYVKGQYGAELYTKSINGIKINDTIVSKAAAKYFVVKNEEGLTTSVVEAWTTADSLPVTGTYKLATDVNVTANSTKKEYALTGDLDLDLSGHTITCTVATGQNEAYIYRDSGHNLIIRDSSEGKTGTMKMVPEAAGTISTSQISIVEVKGTTTLEGGTLDNTAITSSHVTFSGAITVNGGTFTVNGGVLKGQKNTSTMTSGYVGGSAIGIRNNGGTVEINGGKIYGWVDPAEVADEMTGAQLSDACSAGSVVAAHAGAITINGGELYGSNTIEGGSVIYLYNAASVLDINGGKIYGGYVGGHYGPELRTRSTNAVINIDGTKATAAAGKYFVVTDENGKVTSLISEWNKNTSLPTSGTYVLTTDVAISANTQLTGNLDIDLNGYTITRTVATGVNEAYVFRDNTYNLVIRDSSAEQTGLIKMVHEVPGTVCTSQIAAVEVKGTTTLEGGTIDNTGMISSYTNAHTGAITINAGKFIMNGGVIKGQKNTGTSYTYASSVIGVRTSSAGSVEINGGKLYAWKDPAEVEAGKTGASLTVACNRGAVINAIGGNITINGGELHGANVTTHGGIIFTAGNVYINGGLITDGYANNASGGVYCSGTEMIITGGTIKNNSNANANAAKAYNVAKDKGTLTISGGTIGGGIGISGTNAKLVLTGKPVIGEIEGTLYRADVLINGTTASVHIGSADSEAVQTAQGKYEVVYDDDGNVVDVITFEPKWTDATSLPTSGTYKLTTNVNINADANSMKLTGDLDLDLNGYTITGTINGDIEAYIFRTNGHALVIRDSSAGQTGTLKMQHASVAAGTKQIAAVLADNGGTFTLEGGTLDNTAITTSHAAFSATVTLNNGTFIMNDGIVKGQKNTSTTGGSAIGTRTNASTITINGGKVYGWTDPAEADMPAAERTAANNQGSVIYTGIDTTITINGGELYGSNTTKQGSVISSYDSASTVNIKGGKIYGGYVDGQYGAELKTKSATGIMINDTVVSTAAGEYFIVTNAEGVATSLIQAWTNATSLPKSGVVKLFTDVNVAALDNEMKITGDLDIDLNGHTITGTVPSDKQVGYVFRDDGKNLTIRDSSAAQTGTIKMVADHTCTSQVTAVYVTGNTTLLGGTLDNSAIVSSYGTNTGTVTVNAGTFTMKGGVIKGQKSESSTSAGTGSAIGMRGTGGAVTIDGGKIYGWVDPAEASVPVAERTPASLAGSVITGCSGSTITINGGELYGSTVTYHGGVIYSVGNVYINGGLITGGYAGNHGGVFCSGTEMVVTGGTIQNNSNTGSVGYNLYKSNGTLTVSGGTIGGGIGVTNDAVVVLSGTPVIQEVEDTQYSADLRIITSGTIKLGTTTAATAAGKYFVGTNDAGAITSVILGWETKDALPTSGNVKLLTDVAVSADTKLEGTLELDLNGHTITRTLGEDAAVGGYVYHTNGNTLTILDSGEGGTVKLLPNENVEVYSGITSVVYDNHVFHLRGGMLDGSAVSTSYVTANSGAVTVASVFHMHDGIIKGQQNTGTTKGVGGSAIGMRNNTTVNIHGGEIYGWKAANEANKTGSALTKDACITGAVIMAGTGTKITINDGELHGARAGYAGGVIYTAGDLFVNGGKLVGGHGVTHGGLVYSTGNITITGGELSGGYALNASGGIYCTGETTMTISGGIIKNNKNSDTNATKGNNIIKDKGTLTISGGTIGGGVGISGTNVKLVLSGKAIIDRRLDALDRADVMISSSTGSIYLNSADTTAIATATGNYEVVEDAEGNITGVQSLDAVDPNAPIVWHADDVLPTHGNVKLNTDVNVSEDTLLVGNLVLDLNGHTITRTVKTGVNEAYAFRDMTYALTIVDSSDEQNGMIKMVHEVPGTICGSQVAAIEVKGTVTLESGTIDNTGMISAYGNTSSGAITVNGGAFIMNGGVVKGQKNTSTTDFASSVIGIRTNAAGSVTITGGKLYAWKDPAEVAAGKTGTGLTAACVNGTVINAQVGTITINGGEFYGSRAANAGGIIYTSGDLTINNVEISGGIASGNGKNIYCTGNAYITITDATIDGGVYIDMASVTISGNTNIVGNPYGLKLASGQVADFTGLTGKVSVDAEGVFTTQFASGEAAQAMLDSGRIVAGAGCTFTVNGNAIESSAGKITVGDEEYDSLAEAVKSANSGETVSVTTNVEEGLLSIPAGVTVEVDRNVDINVNTLIVDSNATMSLNTANVNVDTILIQDNGKLDLGESEVRVDMLHISDGAQLIGTPEKSKLYVEKDGVALHGTPADDGKYQIMPIWDPVEECYEFSRFMIQDEEKDGRGLRVDEEQDVITFQFKHNATKALNKELLGKATNNTEEENAISICVKLTWTSANGEEGSWHGYYAANLVRDVASNYRADGGTPKDYVLRLNGFLKNQNVEQFTIQAYVDFARGDYAVYGQEYHWYRNNAG